MTTIRAHFDDKTFVPDEPVKMPVNQQVTLHVETGVNGSSGVGGAEERLKALEELEKMAEGGGGGDQKADWSRESIYSGTVNDPR